MLFQIPQNCKHLQIEGVSTDQEMRKSLHFWPLSLRQSFQSSKKAAISQVKIRRVLDV